MNETKEPSGPFREAPGDHGDTVNDRPFPLLRPNPRESLPGGLLVALGALVFWLLAREKSPESLGPLALACGAPVLAGLVWMILRRYYQALFLSGQLLLLVLGTSGGLRSAPFPLGLVPLLPAALMLWGVAGIARKCDELERRVLEGAVAIAFGIGLCATVVYGAAETLGASRAPAILWFAILVVALYAGLMITARRYSR
jgi:hypothetical protein